MIGNLARLHLLSYLSLKDFLVDVRLEDKYYKIDYFVPNLKQFPEGVRIQVGGFVRKVEALKGKLNSLDDDSPKVYHFDDQQIMGLVHLEIPSELIANFIGAFGKQNRTLEGYQYCLKQLEKEEKENYLEELDLLTEERNGSSAGEEGEDVLENLLEDVLDEVFHKTHRDSLNIKSNEKSNVAFDPDDMLEATLADFESPILAIIDGDEKDDPGLDLDNILDSTLSEFESAPQKNPQKRPTEKALIARAMALQFTKGIDASDEVASLGLEEMQANLASLQQRNNTFKAGFLVQPKQSKQQKREGLPTDFAIRNVLLADQLCLLGKIEGENLITALMQLSAISLENKKYKLAAHFSELTYNLERSYGSSSEESLSAALLEMCQQRCAQVDTSDIEAYLTAVNESSDVDSDAQEGFSLTSRVLVSLLLTYLIERALYDPSCDLTTELFCNYQLQTAFFANAIAFGDYGVSLARFGGEAVLDGAVSLAGKCAAFFGDYFAADQDSNANDELGTTSSTPTHGSVSSN